MRPKTNKTSIPVAWLCAPLPVLPGRENCGAIEHEVNKKQIPAKKPFKFSYDKFRSVRTSRVPVSEQLMQSDA